MKNRALIRGARWSILAAAILSLGVWTALLAQQNQAIVSRATGIVRFQRAASGPWRPVRVGTVLQNGDRVQTGPQSRVVIRTPHAELRLDEKSEADLSEMLNAAAQRVDLRRGFGWFDVQPADGRRFEARTPTTVASVRGTKFAVGSSDSGVISCVCQGEIETATLADPDDTEEAESGDSNDYSASGDFSKRDLARFFRKLKVDRSFQSVIDDNAQFRNCTSCHRMTDLATDHSPDPASY